MEGDGVYWAGTRATFLAVLHRRQLRGLALVCMLAPARACCIACLPFFCWARCGGALSAAESRVPLLPELRQRSRTRLQACKQQGCRAAEVSLRCFTPSAAQGPDEAVAASSQLHKQLLAQEVVKLRREVATLRAADSAPGPASSAEEEEIRSCDYFMCCVSPFPTHCESRRADERTPCADVYKTRRGI